MKRRKDKIGFIGLGNVGKLLANSILVGQYHLNVYDIDKLKAKELIKNGAFWKNNLKELVKDSNIIITCLPSPKIVSKVIEGELGIINHINKDHLWIEMSTTDEKEMIRLSKLFEKKGSNVLEAPVTGGQHRAETGNISILVAGKRKFFDRVFPILSEIGYEILYCGKLGNASTLKVVTNFLASVNLLSIGEALMVCKKYGLDLKTAYHGIRISSGNSFVHETEGQLILNGSFDAGFTMDLVCKDVGLFNKLITKFNISPIFSSLIFNFFKKGKKKYGDKSLSTGIIKFIEENNNDLMRANNFPKKLKDYKYRKKGIEIKF